MKNIVLFLLSMLTSLFLPGLHAQENLKLPRFTEFRTDADFDKGEWQDKIVDEVEIGNYVVQLITSQEKGDYFSEGRYVQVLDKTNRRLVQEEIDLKGYGSVWDDQLYVDDYNFDGYDDFSLFQGSGTLDNIYFGYFLYNPETKTFFESEFGGTNMEFYPASKTITTRNRSYAGANMTLETYKVVGFRMILLERHCLTAERIEDEETGKTSVCIDEEGNFVFEEVDCYEYYMDVEQESVGLKKNFQLRLAIYDEDMAGGFVLYKGQKERIPIYLDRSEIVEQGEEERPATRELFYNEMYQEKVNGVYVATIQGSNIIKVCYIRGKDNKKFTLKEIAR